MDKSAQSPFKNLRVWNDAMELAQTAYVLTKSFPSQEKYGLISQIRRCAVSVPSNIAEGYRRASTNDFKHFLQMALGSLAELETQVLLSSRLDLFRDRNDHKVLKQISTLSGRIIVFIKNLKRKTNFPAPE